jgi:endonuclease YncB( thermonuclease family)
MRPQQSADPDEATTRSESVSDAGRQAHTGWWQRRTRNQRWAVIGVGAIFILGSINSLAATDEPGPVAAGATATAEPSATPRATASPHPSASAQQGAVPTPRLGAEPSGITVRGHVVDVVDGDTIKVEIDGAVYTVRYIGIDTPETVHPTQPVEWMGPEASEANSELVADQEVILEKDVSETDQFGRLLRYVWLERAADWLLVNRELVRLGFANSSTYPPDVAYQELFLEAEAEARNAGTGLWGATPSPVPTLAPTVPPPPLSTPAPSNCHPSYSNVCLSIGIGDYDCAGGSGDGPNYVRGPVLVVGYDEFRLDGNGDGVGCE